MQTRGRLRLSIGMAGLVLVVIPGWRVCAGPGIQLPSLSLFLDSGFALSAPRNDSGAAFSLPSPSRSRIYPTSVHLIVGECRVSETNCATQSLVSPPCANAS